MFQLPFQVDYLIFELSDDLSILRDMVLNIEHVTLDSGFNVLGSICILKGVVCILIASIRR